MVIPPHTARAHRSPFFYMGINKVLLFQAIERRVHRPGGDLPIQSGLDASENGSAIGFVCEGPDCKQNSLFESAE
jgi:hypothetical protein